MQSHLNVSMFENLLLFYHHFEGKYITITNVLKIIVLLLPHGDIEPNPDPVKLKEITFWLLVES